MRKTQLPATASLTAVLMLGCGQSPTAPSEAAQDASAPSFSAANSKFSFQQPVDHVFGVPCANGGVGEDVHVTGSQVISIKETISASGNYKFRLHIKPEGLMAVGLTSGDTWWGSRSPGQIVEISQPDGFPYVLVLLPQPIVLHGTGSTTGTMQIYESLKLTFNNNGMPTASIANFSSTCVGRGH